MCEHSIAAARASVVIYDDGNKKWVASGSSKGVSKVQIYHNSLNDTFRIVGRKLQDHEVVINCSITKDLKYNQAMPLFHQWWDSRQVYGLNFTRTEEADKFAHAILTALETLRGVSNKNKLDILRQGVSQRMHMLPQSPLQPRQMIIQSQRMNSRNTNQFQHNQPHIQQQQPASHNQPELQMARHGALQPASTQNLPNCINHESSETDQSWMGGIDRENYHGHQRKIPQGSLQPVYCVEVDGPPNLDSRNQISQVMPNQSSIPVTSNVPYPPALPAAPPLAVRPPAAASPAPPPAPCIENTPVVNNVLIIPQPPAPFAPSFLSDSGEAGLAPMRENTTLEKIDIKPPKEEDSNSAAKSDTLGRAPKDDVVTEMARKLLEQRKKSEADTNDPETATASVEKKMEKNETNGNKMTIGNESPKLGVNRRFQSLTVQENFSSANSATPSSTGLSTELATLKQNILSEVRAEIRKAKQEIIEAVRVELAQR